MLTICIYPKCSYITLIYYVLYILTIYSYDIDIYLISDSLIYVVYYKVVPISVASLLYDNIPFTYEVYSPKTLDLR
jgi:hypothetical protein